MMKKSIPRFLNVLLRPALLGCFLLGTAGPLPVSAASPPTSRGVALTLARLETALLLRRLGVAHEEVGRLESAFRSYEESLMLFPDDEVAQRVPRVRAALARRAAPLSPPAPLLPEARTARLERAFELREEGKNAFVRGEMRNAVRSFEESLALFEDEELSRFVGEVKKEIELALSLDGLEGLFG